MTWLQFFFWLSLGILFYCYTGYGMLVFVLNRIRAIFRPRPPLPENNPPLPVTLVVTAYNEEDVLPEKIRNIAAIDYPAALLKVIIVTDGSSDHSPGLVSRFPGLRLLHEPARKGKYAAVKRAMLYVDTPFVVFSDANAILNPDCLRKMMRHYADPRVGGVAGEKKIGTSRVVSAMGQAEGLYWKYESFLKRADAGLWTVVGAAGELFSIRTELFSALGDEWILDDFIISMQVCLQGFTIAYEPGAFATESASASLAEEEKRKIRIAAGAYQSIGFLKNRLSFFRQPLLTFQFISRRLLRWVVCPLMLGVLFVSSIILISLPGHSVFYDAFVWAEGIFSAMALAGYLLVRAGKRAGLFTIPFYFIFMHYCLARGFARYRNGTQTVLWEKSMRQAVE